MTLYAGVLDYMGFKQAFAQAKEAGATEFSWRGGRYHTRTAEEEQQFVAEEIDRAWEARVADLRLENDQLRAQIRHLQEPAIQARMRHPAPYMMIVPKEIADPSALARARREGAQAMLEALTFEGYKKPGKRFVSWVEDHDVMQVPEVRAALQMVAEGDEDQQGEGQKG